MATVRETGSGNILGCATDTCDFVVLTPKTTVLTNAVKLLSTLTDIDRHRKQDGYQQTGSDVFELHD